MRGTTHMVVGAAAGVLAAAYFNEPALVGVALFAAIVPDLDASEATLKHWEITISGKGKHRVGVKPFYLLSELVSRLLPHRSLLHSLWAAVILSLVTLFAGWAIALAFFLGYLSHLLLDSLSPAGVPLFLRPGWHLLPQKLWIPTGSPIESIVEVIGVMIVLSYLIIYTMTGSYAPL